MHKNGFTLIEIIVVMAILITILIFGFFISLQNYYSYSTVNERNLLVSILLKARNQAVNNVCIGNSCTSGKSHGVKIVYDGTTHKIQKYVIFQGNSYSANNSLNQDIGANYQLFFLQNQANPVSEIVFDQLSGQVNLNGNEIGTIELSDMSNHDYSITINTEGQINW